MAGLDDPALDKFEQALAERNGEFDLPDDLLSEDENETPVQATNRRVTFKAKEDVKSPYEHKHALTGSITAHSQIYTVNEQIIHGKSTWSNSLCAFDSLHSANTEARSHAIFQHAKGDASIVQTSFRNGYGTWTTNMDTERGRIIKSVFVNAVLLHYLTTPPANQYEDRAVPRDRFIPSKVPGSQRFRQIQAFRSTDSIRTDSEQLTLTRHTINSRSARPPKPALRENLRKGNQMRIDKRREQGDDDGEGEGEEMAPKATEKNSMHKQRSISDLREFASLHTLF